MENDAALKKHPLFKELKSCIKFYEYLSDSVSHWLTLGTRPIINIDSCLYGSIKETLMSINTILLRNRTGDAYTLLRRYYDLVVMNIYINLYLDENHNDQNSLVKEIDSWIRGKSRIPEYRIMSEYIRKSSRVSVINNIIFSNDGISHYKNIRNRCNDYAHYNLFINVLHNNPEIVFEKNKNMLNEFVVDLRYIMIMHLSYIFFIRENYMMSSQYIDCLECGMTPEKDSEYLVSPFVQYIFDRVVKKYRPDIASAIINHTNMKLS